MRYGWGVIVQVEEDKAYYSASSAGVSIALGNGSLGYGGDAEGDWLVNVEAIDGSAHNDTIWGDNADNQFDGWKGMISSRAAAAPTG